MALHLDAWNDRCVGTCVAFQITWTALASSLKSGDLFFNLCLGAFSYECVWIQIVLKPFSHLVVHIIGFAICRSVLGQIWAKAWCALVHCKGALGIAKSVTIRMSSPFCISLKLATTLHLKTCYAFSFTCHCLTFQKVIRKGYQTLCFALLGHWGTAYSKIVKNFVLSFERIIL